MAARIIADACEALDYAHTFKDGSGERLNLVHRDISPQNILVSEEGVVKLVDFGVAKAATSTHKTQTGAVKGKFCYMSPEQIGGHPLDARSDLFAVGIVLYELLTGRRPFGHESELMAVTAILNQPPPPPRQFGADVPDGLQAILFRALEKNRETRFQTADELQAALEGYLTSSGQLVRTKDLANGLAVLFGEKPRFSQTIPTGPALAETIVEEQASALLPGPHQVPVTPEGTEPGYHQTGASSPAQPAPGSYSPPGSNPGFAGQTAPDGVPPQVILAPGHAEATRSVTPNAAGNSSKGIGIGLIFLLVLVLGALGGGGYFLLTQLQKDGPNGQDTGVAEADSELEQDAQVIGHDGIDAGAVAEDAPVAVEDIAPLDEPSSVPDAVVAQLDAQALAETTATGPDALSPVDAGVIISDAAVPTVDLGVTSVVDSGPAVDDAIIVPDTSDDTNVTVEADAEALAVEDVAAPPDTGTTATADTAAAIDTEQASDVVVVEDDRGSSPDRAEDSRPGRLTVTAAPPGRYEVRVDGELVGTTPLTNHELPPGRYRVEVSRVGGSDSDTRRVRVRPGRRVSEFFDFRD